MKPMPRLKRSRPLRPRQPKSIQIAYWALLKPTIRKAIRLVNERLVPLLPMLMERANPGAYADALPPGKRVNNVIAAIRNQMQRETGKERAERAPRAISKMVSDFNIALIEKQGLPVRLAGTRSAVEAFVHENVALIRSVPAKYLEEVEQSVHRAIASGDRHETLAKVIKERGAVAENRAKLIARDQTTKFFGALNRLRQNAAGVEKFTWRSSGDERVRESHAELDGQVFSWSDLPPEGYPGFEIQCRCSAEPVLPELEE